MEFFDLYGQYIGPLLLSLSKIQINITAIQLIQVTAAIIGACVSVFGAYKAWRYAEKRLGIRLEEFLEKEQARLLEARKVARAIRSGREEEYRLSSPIFSNDELMSALSLVGKKDFDNARASLDEALHRSRERASLAQDSAELHMKQQAMSHLLLGAIADAGGDHQSALEHFQLALELDPNDVEALEYAGLQYFKLGNHRQALDEFSKMETIARVTDDRLMPAQALKYCGQCYEQLSTPLHAKANAAYKEAICIFPRSGPQLLLAELNERRGVVNIRLGNLPLARRSLKDGLTLAVRYERRQVNQTGKAPVGLATRILAVLDGLEHQHLAHRERDEQNRANGLSSRQQQLPQQPPNGERPN